MKEKERKKNDKEVERRIRKEGIRMTGEGKGKNQGKEKNEKEKQERQRKGDGAGQVPEVHHCQAV
jgi:hypothetical protein